jgi:glucuronokinase
VSVEPAERIEIAGAALARDLREATALGRARSERDGAALLTAALKKLVDHAPRLLDVPHRGFRLSFATDIPRQVGLAGSSAIVVAALRALARWFGLEVGPESVAELALRAETEELGITAGPMDRVVQAHEGLLSMDFRPPGSRERLDPAVLPALFIAWDAEPGEPSGAIHDRVRARWERGDAEVIAVVEALAALADEGAEALRTRDVTRLRRLVERNFDLRASVWGLAPRDAELAAIGRREGAAVKLAGSGGAALGVLHDEHHYDALASAYREAGFLIRPARV